MKKTIKKPVKKITTNKKPQLAKARIKQIVLRASKADIWNNCTGFAHNDTGQDEFRDTDKADLGTLAHLYLTKMIENYLKNKKMPITDPVFENLPDEYKQYAIEAYNHILVMYENVKAVHPTAKLLSEIRYDHIWRNVTITGQFDAAIVTKDSIAVIDFKTGMGEVKAKNNPQLKTYLTLLAIHYPERKNFVGVIIQPSLGVVEQDTFDMEYPIAYLNSFAAKVAEHDKVFVTGAHCKYCPHNDVCKEFLGKVQYFLSPEFSGEIISRKENWLQIIELAKPLETLIESVKKKAKMYLESGMSIEGLSLGQRPGKRFWVDSVDAAQIAKAAGLKKSDIMTESLLSPTDVIKQAKNPEKLKGMYAQAKYSTVKAGVENGYFD